MLSEKQRDRVERLRLIISDSMPYSAPKTTLEHVDRLKEALRIIDSLEQGTLLERLLLSGNTICDGEFLYGYGVHLKDGQDKKKFFSTTAKDERVWYDTFPELASFLESHINQTEQ